MEVKRVSRDFNVEKTMVNVSVNVNNNTIINCAIDIKNPKPNKTVVAEINSYFFDWYSFIPIIPIHPNPPRIHFENDKFI